MKGFTLLKDYEAFEILFEKLSIKERLPPKLPNSNNPVENEKHLKMLSYFLSQIPRTKLFHPPYDTFFTQLKKQSIVNID